MNFGQKVQEFIYSISTNDKYSEFDSRKSFNRINKPESETNLLFSHHNSTTSEFISPGLASEELSDLADNGGVHEVKLAWRHIKNWLARYSPDLESSLEDKCTDDDLNDFQKDLNIKLPACVVEFYKLTDGQSNFGTETTTSSEGLVFGLKLMSLDEIVIMTGNWRKVATIFNDEMSQVKQSNKLSELSKLQTSYSQGVQVSKKFASLSDIDSINETMDLGEMSKSSRTSSSSSSASHASSPQLNIPAQRSVPPGAIHATFAHPMWIPIITDEVGNYIGIDLSPPPNGPGVVGQVILFGREFDYKFKLADNFGDFMLIFANDLEKGNWDIKTKQKNNYGDLMLGNEGSLVYMDKEAKLEVPYLDVLKRRSINHWLKSLEKSHAEITPEIRQLILDLKSRDSFVLNFKNTNTVDKSIYNNISSIDDLNEPVNSSSENLPARTRSSTGSISRKPNVRSPLSNNATDEVMKEIHFNRQDGNKKLDNAS